MKNILILFPVLIILNCSPDAEQWEMRHDNEFELGNLNLALDYINNSISLDSLNHRTFFKRGLVYKELKENTRAILDFEKAVQLNEKDFYSLTNLGQIYSKIEEYDKAFSYYNNALVIKKNPSIFVDRGETFLKLKDTINAEKDFHKAIELDSASIHAYLNLGLLSFEQSNFETSIRLFEKAFNSFSPNKSTSVDIDLKLLILTYRGLAKVNIGKREEACHDWSLKLNKK